MDKQGSVLIVGSGHIAQALAAEGGAPAVDASRGFDAARPFDIVVCADEIGVEEAERDPQKAMQVCAFTPAALWAKLHAAGKRMVYVGSGCVWDGPYREDDQPFTPEDAPTPASFYGHARVAGEYMLSAISTDGLAILRPRLVYSADDHPDNALRKFLAFESLNTVPQSMTSIGTLAKAIRALAASAGGEDSLWGRTSCVYDMGSLSPLDIAWALHDAGQRGEPQQRPGHPPDEQPRRVDVVMHDDLFESFVRPPWLIDEILRCAAALRPEG